MSKADSRASPLSGGFPGVRHRQLAILLPGLFLAYTCRVNLSVGIVSMTDTTSNSSFSTVNWDTAQKGAILGTFFYGYVLGGPPSGYVVNKISPSKTLGTAAVICGVCNVVFPWIAVNFGFTASCIMRIVQGLSQACMFPGAQALISRWAVPKEHGWINSFVCSGVSSGSTVTLIIGGLLAAGPTGWPSIFYITGGAFAVWGVVCFTFVFDDPNEHKTISERELNFIESQKKSDDTNEKPPVPWRKILTSIPIWVCTFTGLTFNWGYWTLSTLVPTYLKSTLDFDTSENGLVSALPNLAMFICCLGFPFLDKMMSDFFAPSIGFKRKFWTSVCLFIPAVALLVLAFSHVNPTATVSLLVIATAMNAALYQGFQANPLDLTTNFTGLVGGITNGLSSLTAIVSPTVAGQLIQDETNFADWQIVFLLAAVIYIVGNVTFVIFGSGEIQPWDNIPEANCKIDTEGTDE